MGENMQKTVITFLILLSQLSFANVVTSNDKENKCTLYRVTTDETPIKDQEQIYSEKEVYGITFQNLEIQFNDKTVTVVPMMNIVMGLNRPLMNSKLLIKSSNPDFSNLINQLNRKLLSLEKLCVNQNAEVVYAKTFESTNN
jgi:hypothetical protein